MKIKKYRKNVRKHVTTSFSRKEGEVETKIIDIDE